MSGPGNGGKLELQPLDQSRSRLIYTWHLEPEQVPGPKAGNPDELMAQRLKGDLERMKAYIEAASEHQANNISASGTVQGRSNQNSAFTPGAPANIGTSATVGEFGGTDAAASAKLSGSKGGPGGPSLRELVDNTDVSAGAPNGDSISPNAGVEAVGGTGLGSTATADDSRTGTGTSSASGTPLTGAGKSGARSL